MNTPEHLNKIKAKCEELLETHKGLDGYFTTRAIAGWRSTIAAIAFLKQLQLHYSEHGGNNGLLIAFIEEQESDIISAWPEEIL